MVFCIIIECCSRKEELTLTNNGPLGKPLCLYSRNINSFFFVIMLGKFLEDRFNWEFRIILWRGKLLPCSLRHEINLSGDLVFPSFYHLVLASIMYLTTSCIALHTKSNQKICREQSKNLLVHWPSFMLYKAEKRGA